jgi:hypothetical protein
MSVIEAAFMTAYSKHPASNKRSTMFYMHASVFIKK